MKNEHKEKHLSNGHTKGGKQLYWFTEKEFESVISEAIAFRELPEPYKKGG